jgi:hypothetical protein
MRSGTSKQSAVDSKTVLRMLNRRSSLILFLVTPRGHGPQAAAEFQKIIDHPGVWPSSPVHSLAHLGLARAYSLVGDKAKARTAYQDFLALWRRPTPTSPS